jgi:hypothetical protein
MLEAWYARAVLPVRDDCVLALSSLAGRNQLDLTGSARRFSRPEPGSSKDKSYREIRDNQAGEVAVVVPSPSRAVSGPKFPSDLARVVAAWDRLPEAIKAGVLALVQAARASDA